MFKFKYISLFFIVFCQTLAAQQTFKLTLLEGTAKIQRAGKKSWDNLTLNDEFNDNDIIETYFQTKATLQYGAANLIILGSNTRALLNIKENEDESDRLDVNATVFSGGVLVKAVSKTHVNIFTSNAVAEIDKGTITTIVEAKTGHTGFQVLGGGAKVRNVSQQQMKNLNLGLTTIVLPDKEPTAPLYITYRHVAVLKHFFGENFIDKQIDDAGITPTEQQGGTNRLSLSQNMKQGKSQADGQMYKKVFTKDRLYGYILADLNENLIIYAPINKPSRVHSNKADLDFKASIGIAGGQTFPKFTLVPSFHFPKFSVGINVPLAKNGSGRVQFNIASAPGFFDKIHHLTIGNEDKKRFLKFGAIDNYTIAEGLLVDNFKNKSIYTVTQPLGIVGKFQKNAIDFDIFISDVTNWLIGGAHISFVPGTAMLGFGYYYDGNQFKSTLIQKNSRFLDLKQYEEYETIFLNEDQKKSNAHIWEVNLCKSLYVSPFFNIDILFQYARKMAGDSYRNGYIMKGPEFKFHYKQFSFGFTYIQQNGGLLSSHFSQMYMSNRLRIHDINEKNKTISYQTQNMYLIDSEGIFHRGSRRTYGGIVYFNMNPKKGMDLNFSLHQDLYTFKNYTLETDSGDIKINDRQKSNFNFMLSFAINKDFFAPISYAKVYIKQIHGGYYPQLATYFKSWGFSAGLDALTKPLFANIAIQGGIKFNYIDLADGTNDFGKLDNDIDGEDTLIEFYLGLRWGFL